jgi:hypothetical protein
MLLDKLDPKRVAYIMHGVFGSNTRLLFEFFSKSQKLLISTGMKLDTIPKDGKKAISLFTNMPEKATLIAHDWIYKHYKNLEAHSVEEVIGSFLLNEYDVKSIETSEQNTAYCIFILIDLLSKEPNDKIVNFMKTGIIDIFPSEVEKIAPIPSIKNEEEKLSVILPKLLSVINNIANEDFSVIKDVELVSLLGLVDINSYEVVKRKFLERVKELGMQSTVYEEYINHIENKFPQFVDTKIDFQIPNKLNSLKDFEATDYQIFGVISNVIESSGTIFIEILSLLKNGVFYELSHEDRKSLFPTRGSIIWLSRGHKRILSENEYGIFSIKLDETRDNIKSKYAVEKLIDQVFPVSLCELPLGNIGNIRSWLASHEHYLATTNSYVLIDKKTLIKPSLSSRSTIDFEKPMDSFNNVKIFMTDKAYYISEVGYSNLRVDFSPADKYFKVLLKSGLAEKNNLSRDFVSKLIDDFNAVKNGQNSENINEIITTLDEVLAKDSIFTELISQLSGSEKVQQAINLRIEQEVIARTSNSDRLKTEITQLEARKINLEKTIVKEEEQQKKLRLGLSADIKSTFEKSIQDGRKILSEVALFEAIISPNQSKSENISSIKTSAIIANEQKYYSLKVFKKVDGSPMEDLRKLRFITTHISHLFDALNDAMLIGLTPAFTGNASRIFADAFINTLSVDSVLEFSIGPGTTSIPELLDKKYLIDQSKCFLLKNFDISPISLYGHVLSDLCYQKFLSGTAVDAPIVVLTFEDSGLGLEYPLALKSSLVIVDTDQITFQDDDIDLDDLQEKINEMDSIDFLTKKTLSNLIRSLKVSEIIDETDRFKRLCRFLSKSYFNHFVMNISSSL